MAYPKKLLSEDESVVLDTHPHWKTLVVPTFELLVVLVLVGFGLAYFDQSWARWATAGVGAFLLVVFFVVPFLRWRTTELVVTTRRVVTRTGILGRSGRDVPMSRVNDVSFTQNLFERMLGCGVLTVESAGERGQVVLTDVAHVAQVQKMIYDLTEKAGREA